MITVINTEDLTHADEELVEVLRKAWIEPFTTRCDFARGHAEVLAVAAHLRYVTTLTEPTYDGARFGNVWRITPKGLDALWRWKGAGGIV